MPELQAQSARTTSIIKVGEAIFSDLGELEKVITDLAQQKLRIRHLHENIDL